MRFSVGSSFPSVDVLTFWNRRFWTLYMLHTQAQLLRMISTCRNLHSCACSVWFGRWPNTPQLFIFFKFFSYSFTGITYKHITYKLLHYNLTTQPYSTFLPPSPPSPSPHRTKQTNKKRKKNEIKKLRKRG